MSAPIVLENPHKWWVLVATGLCLGLSFLDQTAVVVIFPSIQKSLAASTLQMEWVINTYMLTMSVLFVLGGRLGDLYGEKKLFLIGLSIFGLASVICGTSTHIITLIAARALQGIGSALFIPAQSIIILSAFPLAERGRAMGINLSIASIFLVLGGFIGGALAEWASWQLVFWLNVPLCLFSLIMAIWAILPDKLKTRTYALDWHGLFWQLLSISSLVIAIMELGYWPFSLCAILLFISMLSAYLLYKIEQNKTHPLISFHIFKIRIFVTGCIMITLMQMVLVSGVFSSLFYQYVLGASPAMAGIMTLPGVLPVVFMGPVAGLLIDRLGARLPLLLGLSLMIFSCVWSALVLHYRDYWLLLPALIASGFAIPLIMNCIFAPSLNAIELHNRGVASGTLGMLRQVGSSVGLAIASALVNLINHWRIDVQLSRTHLNTTRSTLQQIFSHPSLLYSFSLQEQAQMLKIVKNALTIAINSISVWTSLVVIIMWYIAFIRTKHNPGFLKSDRP